MVDPFGRQATFSYNGSGQLVTITDAIGMQSHLRYQTGDMVASMTTPYGTTAFARSQSSAVDSLRFPRFCGLGCDKGKDSHEEQEERSALRPRV